MDLALVAAEAPQMSASVRTYQRALEPFSTPGVVEPRWLHLTMAGVTLTFDDVVVGREAVALVARPTPELVGLHRDLVTAIADVLQDDAPRADPDARFAPHVSLAYAYAYANAAQPASLVRAARRTVLDL